MLYAFSLDHKKDWCQRSSDGCRTKFLGLALKPPPTGASVPSEFVVRAKKIKEDIDREEAIGYSSLNDGSDVDGGDGDVFLSSSSGSDGGVGSALGGANVLTANGRRPMTRRSKNAFIFKSIDMLAEGNVASANALVQALEALWKLRLANQHGECQDHRTSIKGRQLSQHRQHRQQHL